MQLKKIFLLSSVFALCLSVSPLVAEEKTCAVKGMHCDGCAENVKSKVCVDNLYSTCDVKVFAKQNRGEIHLVTTNPAEKIDEAKVKEAILDAGYNLEVCKAKAGKAKKT